MNFIYLKKFLVVSTINSIFILFVACAPHHDEVAMSSHHPEVDTLSESNIKFKSCQFIGSKALESFLTVQFELDGDIPMVDDIGNVLKGRKCKSYMNEASSASECYYLKEYKTELETQECTQTVFKLVSKIMLNACHMGLQNARVADRLFPRGSHDPDSIYRSFTATQIKNNERDILKDLALSFSKEEEKRIAVCAAVASSLLTLSL